MPHANDDTVGSTGISCCACWLAHSSGIVARPSCMASCAEHSRRLQPAACAGAGREWTYAILDTRCTTSSSFTKR